MGRDGIGEANNQTVEFLVFDTPASTLWLKCYHQSIKSDRMMFLIIKFWQQQLRIFDKMIEKSLTGIYLQNTKVPSTLIHFICFIQASSDNYRALATHPHEPIFNISESGLKLWKSSTIWPLYDTFQCLLGHSKVIYCQALYLISKSINLSLSLRDREIELTLLSLSILITITF